MLFNFGVIKTKTKNMPGFTVFQSTLCYQQEDILCYILAYICTLYTVVYYITCSNQLMQQLNSPWNTGSDFPASGYYKELCRLCMLCLWQNQKQILFFLSPASGLKHRKVFWFCSPFCVLRCKIFEIASNLVNID